MWLRPHKGERLPSRDTGVTIGNGGIGAIGPDGVPTNPYPQDEITKAGLIDKHTNGIKALQRGTLPWYSITAMVDLNYSFKIGDNTDLGIGLYFEYDPLGHKPTQTNFTAEMNNTSLIEWRNQPSAYSETPIFYRNYSSVLESYRADGVSQRTQNDFSGSRIVTKYNRASAGIRISVSLWSIPLENGKNYRKQQRFMKDCNCELW